MSRVVCRGKKTNEIPFRFVSIVEACYQMCLLPVFMVDDTTAISFKYRHQNQNINTDQDEFTSISRASMGESIDACKY